MVLRDWAFLRSGCCSAWSWKTRLGIHEFIRGRSGAAKDPKPRIHDPIIQLMKFAVCLLNCKRVLCPLQTWWDLVNILSNNQYVARVLGGRLSRRSFAHICTGSKKRAGKWLNFHLFSKSITSNKLDILYILMRNHDAQAIWINRKYTRLILRKEINLAALLICLALSLCCWHFLFQIPYLSQSVRVWRPWKTSRFHSYYEIGNSRRKSMISPRSKTRSNPIKTQELRGSNSPFWINRLPKGTLVVTPPG